VRSAELDAAIGRFIIDVCPWPDLELL